ncbi:MAG: hypothetical protein JWN04_1717 [Myxococcaceae bacterium]|nr:hypothetical protein [Myxococcaceae bacterium]
MSAQHFYVKLSGPRPTFPSDMTIDERALMQAHADHMRAQFEAGTVLLYGPVFAAPVFGVGIYQAESESEARRLVEADPSVAGGLNQYEIAPMRVVASQAASS